MAGGIEGTILDNIEQNTGETFDDSDPSESSVETGQPQGQDVDVTGQVQDQLQRRTRPTEGGDNLRGPKSRKDAQRGTRPDAKGNIVDESGNVIATGGLARRLHVRAERLDALNKSHETKIGELTRQLAEAKVLNDAPKHYGLDNEAVKDGLYMTALFRQDPAAAAREVLERALAAGVSFHQIVNDDSIPNMQLGAVNRLLDQRLGPIAGNLQEQKAVDQSTRDAMDKTNRFLGDYPDAATHEQEVADQMKIITEEYRSKGVAPDPYIVAEQAFGRVLAFCEKNGLDVKQPLRPQVEARMKSQPGRGVNPRTVPARRPMPNGRGGGEVIGTKSRTANPTESYDSIVREAMRDSGIDI